MNIDFSLIICQCETSYVSIPLGNVSKSLMAQLGVWTKVPKANEDFPHLFSESMIVGTATASTIIIISITITITIASTTKLLLLSSSISTSFCIQNTNTFSLHCLLVLRFEVLVVVLLLIQVLWDVLLY